VACGNGATHEHLRVDAWTDRRPLLDRPFNAHLSSLVGQRRRENHPESRSLGVKCVPYPIAAREAYL
jgi:hypothetical protein